MKFPQVINFNEDSVLAIDGESVIDDTTQTPIGQGGVISTITADMYLWDLRSNTGVGPVGITLSYKTDVDIWTINVSSLTSYLIDRHKYVANIVCVDASNMRSFKISEFCVDNDSFEDTWMRLPYEVDIANHQIRWYDDVANFGATDDHLKFTADIYERGTGLIYATDPSRVTHRGPIIPYVAP